MDTSQFLASNNGSPFPFFASWRRATRSLKHLRWDGGASETRLFFRPEIESCTVRVELDLWLVRTPFCSIGIECLLSEKQFLALNDREGRKAAIENGPPKFGDPYYSNCERAPPVGFGGGQSLVASKIPIRLEPAERRQLAQEYERVEMDGRIASSPERRVKD